MSIIAAGTTTTNALVQTGNTDGTLQLQVNGTTPSVTLNTLGAVGVGSSPSYGTSGQVLTSAGSTAAPTWSTLTVSGTGGTTASGSVTLTSASAGAQSITPTDYGQYVKLPDATTMSKAAQVFNISNVGAYPLTILDSTGATLGSLGPYLTSVVGLAANSTAAGTWILSNTIPIAITARFASSTLETQGRQFIHLDANKTLCITWGTSNVYGVVYDNSTKTWGSNTAIRTNGATLIGTNGVQGIATSSSSALVISQAGTAMESVVLSISGTTITVNTATATTLSGAAGTDIDFLLNINSTYVFSYSIATTKYTQGITISGTTPSVGTALSFGTTVNYQTVGVAVSATGYMMIDHDTTASFTIKSYTVSGNTLTQVSSSSTATNQAYYIFYEVTALSKWIILYYSSGATVGAKCITVSGAATLSVGAEASVAIAPTALNGSSWGAPIMVGTKLTFVFSNSSNNATYAAYFNNTTGNTLVGSSTLTVTFSTTPYIPFYTTGTVAYFTQAGSSNALNFFAFDVSGAAPVRSVITPVVFSYSTTGTAAPAKYSFPYTRPVNRLGTSKYYYAGGQTYLAAKTDATSFVYVASLTGVLGPTNYGYDQNSGWGYTSAPTGGTPSLARYDSIA